MAKVSIIIPAYNKERFILQTLESCKSQTYVDFEIIIIDDCSKDDTAFLVNDFISKNSSLAITFVQNEKNKGVSYSRNRGIQIAEGDSIMFLDADDLLHSEALSLMQQVMIEYDADVVFSQREYFTGNYRFENVINHIKPKVKNLYNPPQIITGGLIQKEIINKYQLQFEPDLKNGEDALFAAELFCLSKEWFYLCDSFYKVRRDDEYSLSRGQWNNPDIEIPRERNILRYMENYYNTGVFYWIEAKTEAIKIIRHKKNAVKDLLNRFRINERPQELYFRIHASEILNSSLEPRWKIMELFYLFPLMESLLIFKILTKLKSLIQ